MLHENRHDRPGGDTGISLGPEPFEGQGRPSAAFLDPALDEVLGYPSNLNETRIPKRRLPAAGREVFPLGLPTERWD
jgi:hypothetical protein